MFYDVDTDIRFPSLETISAPFHVFTYGTAAKWDQPQSHLAKHYKYLYIYIFIYVYLCIGIYICIYIYIHLCQTNTSCCFQCFLGAEQYQKGKK